MGTDKQQPERRILAEVRPLGAEELDQATGGAKPTVSANLGKRSDVKDSHDR